MAKTQQIIKEFLQEYINDLESQVSRVINAIVQKKLDEMMAVINERAVKGDKGDKPVLGADYFLPKDGKDGKDGEDGRDGEDADELKIIMEVFKMIPKPKDGKDGSPDTGEKIVKKINSLEITPEKQIDASHIKNLKRYVRQESMIKLGGGGTGIEIPSGTVDGSNTTFYVTGLPKYLIIDGMSKFETIHYTLTGSTIEIIDGAPPVQYIRAIT